MDMKEIDQLQARVAQLLERIRLNNEAHQKQLRDAFVAGMHYETEYLEEGWSDDNAYKDWRRQVEAEGIKASLEAGREP